MRVFVGGIIIFRSIRQQIIGSITYDISCRRSTLLLSGRPVYVAGLFRNQVNCIAGHFRICLQEIVESYSVLIYGFMYCLLEYIGGEIVFPSDTRESSRDVCFVDAKIVPAGEHATPPQAIDYIAAPLVGEAGAGPGYLPQNEIKSWFLVYKHQAAVRYRRNLIAVEIGQNSTSMQPTLNPGDIVLVDRDDRDVSQSGHMMLVLDPMDGSGMIKRVAVTDLEDGDFRITYYSDNTVSNPPLVYSLKKDFGNDWEKSIVGRVVWAWSDMKEK